MVTVWRFGNPAVSDSSVGRRSESKTKLWAPGHSWLNLALSYPDPSASGLKSQLVQPSRPWVHSPTSSGFVYVCLFWGSLFHEFHLGSSKRVQFFAIFSPTGLALPELCAVDLGGEQSPRGATAGGAAERVGRETDRVKNLRCSTDSTEKAWQNGYGKCLRVWKMIGLVWKCYIIIYTTPDSITFADL